MNTIDAIGLMTGTSLDGIDVSMIRTDGVSIDGWLGDLFVPFSTELRQDLERHLGNSNPPKNLIHQFTMENIAAVSALEASLNMKADVIGFHGQTLWHRPRQGGTPAKTYQMADASLMSERLKRRVVYNFRSNDIDHGGEGAPLIPIYHQAMLNAQKNGVVVNIGGVSNITIMNDDYPIAGDVGPGCALINDCMQLHYQMAFDPDGSHARRGRIHQDVVDEWMADPFFNQPLPKSLDRNHFKTFMQDIGHLGPDDQLATLTSLTARAIDHHVPDDCIEVFLCGGGRLNGYLLALLNGKSQKYKAIESLGLRGDFIESQGFAYMAVRRLYDLPISFPTTTGVTFPCVGGDVVCLSQ